MGHVNRLFWQMLLEMDAWETAYRVIIRHGENCDDLLLISDSQVGSVFGVGHVCDWPFGLHALPLILQSVALDRIQVDLAILPGGREVSKKYYGQGEEY